MDLELVNSRVDRALESNRQAEVIVISMAIGIFSIGIAVILVGYTLENPYVSVGAGVFQLALYWPVYEILKLRRDNIILHVLPALVCSMPPERAADEIEKLLEHLRRRT